jgi:formate dehydrogenase iron-sulfur subunit
MAREGGNERMKGILTDVTRCIGCRRCVEACIAVNKLPRIYTGRFAKGDGLSGGRLTAVAEVGQTGRTVRHQCLHCLEPSCVAACLVGALKKTPDGAVTYDAAKCIGCRYCMLACPFAIPRYEWAERAPRIRKCRMDQACRGESGAPACTEVCPTHATIFGNRADLLAEARRRIESGAGYLPRIWGERDFGGACVLYISDVDVSAVLGFPAAGELARRGVATLAEKSIPSLNRGWTLVTPIQFATVFGSLLGLWLLRRRSRLMAEGGAEAETGEDQ